MKRGPQSWMVRSSPTSSKSRTKTSLRTTPAYTTMKCSNSSIHASLIIFTIVLFSRCPFGVIYVNPVYSPRSLSANLLILLKDPEYFEELVYASLEDLSFFRSFSQKMYFDSFNCHHCARILGYFRANTMDVSEEFLTGDMEKLLENFMRTSIPQGNVQKIRDGHLALFRPSPSPCDSHARNSRITATRLYSNYLVHH